MRTILMMVVGSMLAFGCCKSEAAKSEAPAAEKAPGAAGKTEFVEVQQKAPEAAKANPVDTKAAEAKPAEAQKPEVAPAAEKPAEPKAEDKPAEVKPAEQKAAVPAEAKPAEGDKTVKTASGLIYEDVVVGTGASPVAGRPVVVHYRGTLTTGKEFDASYNRNQPFTFTIGVGQVIKGWDEGVMGMKVGGKRKLTIPADLGYGARGAGGVIPPNATLLFDVELLDVK